MVSLFGNLLFILFHFILCRTSLFCSFCGNLDTLHIEFSIRYQPTFSEDISISYLVGVLSHFQPVCANLHSLVCIINKRADIGNLSRFISCILYMKNSQFDVLWTPDLSVDTYIPRKDCPLFVPLLSDVNRLKAVASCDHTHVFENVRSLVSNCNMTDLVDKLHHLQLLSCICDNPSVS